MRALAVVVALASTGCALFASAHAHHNSRGSACVDTPIFAVIDLVIAGAAAGVGAAADSNGAYATAGVFGASGVIGGISAIRCGERSAPPAGDDLPAASNSAPAFGEAPVDPEARPATPEEMGIQPIAPIVAVPPATPSTLKFRGTPARRACDDDGACPLGETCATAGAEAGHCIQDPAK